MSSLVYAKYDQATNSVNDPNALNYVNLAKPWILDQKAIPIILPPISTWSNTTGLLTFGSALPNYPIATPGWIICGQVGDNTGTGGPAVRGMYPCLIAAGGATAQVYNGGVATTNTGGVTGLFTPTIPTAPTNLATTAGSMASATATDIALFNSNLVGGSMGANGAIRWAGELALANTVNAKTVRIRLGGISMSGIGGMGNQSGFSTSAMIRNKGSQAQQSVLNGQSSFQAFTNGGGGFGYSAVNTATDQLVSFAANLAVGTDFIVLESYTIEVLPG